MTGPRQRLDELDAAREAATAGSWRQHGGDPTYVIADVNSEGDYHDVADTNAYRKPNADEDAALIVAAVNALPALTLALRAVADLADELDAGVQELAEEAERTPLEDVRRNQLLARALGKASAAQGIRAALAPLAAPDTGDEQ